MHHLLDKFTPLCVQDTPSWWPVCQRVIVKYLIHGDVLAEQWKKPEWLPDHNYVSTSFSSIPMWDFNKKSRLVVDLIDVCSGKTKEKETENKIQPPRANFLLCCPQCRQDTRVP